MWSNKIYCPSCKWLSWEWGELEGSYRKEELLSICQPERLLYHCVINEYVNQTLEVCAFVQNIVLGRMLIMVCLFFSPAISNFITVSLSVSLPIHRNSFYVKPVHQKLFFYIGKCTSYSISGNVVQANFRADCTEFKENSCSQFYRSDVAYNCTLNLP